MMERKPYFIVVVNGQYIDIKNTRAEAEARIKEEKRLDQAAFETGWLESEPAKISYSIIERR